MAHDIENAQKRLDRLKDQKAAREKKEAVALAGFNNADDYDAWRVLEDLRALTLSERRAGEVAAAPNKASGGSLTINCGPADLSNGGIAGGRIVSPLRDGYLNFRI